MKRPNQAIAVTGMTGVGKDYLIEKANADHGLTVVNWGTLLGEELAADRDLMMDSTDPARIRAGQFIVCKRILDLQPVAVTCHTVRPEGSLFAYDFELESAFNPSSYVFVTAPPELIYERVRQRNDRGERKSQEIPVEEIALVQDIKLRAVSELAGKLGCNLLVVENTAETLDQNVIAMSNSLAALREDRGMV